MTQDKTIFEGAKWNSEPQQITINYNFSEKMVNDYFRALAHLLKRLHDDLLLRKFGIPAKSKQFASHYERLFLSIEKRTPFACENIYPKDYELMFDTYHNLRWMKNKVLGIRINAPDSLDWKGGSLNQSLEDIMHNSKVYATTYSKIPPSMYNSIEPIITRVFEALEAKVNELNKGHHSAVISVNMPPMDNIRAILRPEVQKYGDLLLIAIWEQWTKERYIQPMKGRIKPDTVKAITFYEILTRAKYINQNLLRFYDAFNADLGISTSRRAVNTAKKDSQRWSESIIRDIEKSIKSSIT